MALWKKTMDNYLPQNTILNLAVVLVVLAMVFPKNILADDVQITNNISASSQTGGNSAQNITEGRSSGEINVEQIINGVNTSPIHIEKTATSGESINIEINRSVGGSNYNLQENVSASVNTAASSSGSLNFNSGFSTATEGLKRLPAIKNEIRNEFTGEMATNTDKQILINKIESSQLEPTTTDNSGINGGRPNFTANVIRIINNFLGEFIKKIGGYLNNLF